MKYYSDVDAVDKVMPIQPSHMPGAIGKPYDFDYSVKPHHSKKHKQSKPYICDVAVTAGDNTVSMCMPDYNFPPKQTCRLHRPFLPMQLRDPGNWEYPEYNTKHIHKGSVDKNDIHKGSVVKNDIHADLDETKPHRFELSSINYKNVNRFIILLVLILVPLIMSKKMFKK